MKNIETCFDSFCFRVLQDLESEDITFKLSLGKNEFVSYITQWSNSFDSISKSIEELIVDKKATIALDFDTEPTIISLQIKDDKVYADIEPSHFHHLTSFSGVCNEKEFITRLYEGLLFGTTFCFDDIGHGWNWHNCRMVCYNMMKSRTIEEYLRTSVVRKVDTYVTKHILIFDGKDVLHVCDETIGYHVPLSDIMIIRDKTGNVISKIDGELLKTEQFESVASSLPEDCDLWVIVKDENNYISPKLIKRKIEGVHELFIKETIKIENLGDDPYGFTSETLWDACENLDFENIKHFLSLGADTTFFFEWLLSSNKGGTTDSVGNPTYEEDENVLRARDEEKTIILQYVLNHYPSIPLTEDMLKTCMWCYSPLCMKFLLEHGANPTDRIEYKYWRSIKVKYRSVLNLIKLRIDEGKDKYGIYQGMKDLLESYGAEDVIVWNDQYGNK